MRASLRNCSNPLEIYKEREKAMKMKLVERFANEIFEKHEALFLSNPLEIYKEREKQMKMKMKMEMEMKMKLVERFANEIFGASSAKGSIEGADISVLEKSMGIQNF